MASTSSAFLVSNRSIRVMSFTTEVLNWQFFGKTSRRRCYFSTFRSRDGRTAREKWQQGDGSATSVPGSPCTAIFSPPPRQLGLVSQPASLASRSVPLGGASGTIHGKNRKLRANLAQVAGPTAVKLSARIARVATTFLGKTVKRTTAVRPSTSEPATGARYSLDSSFCAAPPELSRPTVAVSEEAAEERLSVTVPEGRLIDSKELLTSRFRNAIATNASAVPLTKYLGQFPNMATLFQDGKDIAAGLSAFVRRAARESKSALSVTIEQPKQIVPFSKLSARSLERDQRVRKLSQELLDSPVEAARKRLNEQRPAMKRPDRMLVNWISKVADKPSKQYLAKAEAIKAARAAAEQQTSSILPCSERHMTLTSFSDYGDRTSAAVSRLLPPVTDSLNRQHRLLAAQQSVGLLFSEGECDMNLRHSQELQSIVNQVRDNPSVAADIKDSLSSSGYPASTRFSMPARVRARHLPFGIREKDLEIAFSRFGLAAIKRPVCFLNDTGGRFTGQAHIYFASEAQAKRAVTKMKERWYGTRYWSLSMDSGNPSRPRNSRPLLSINSRPCLPLHQSRVL